MNRHSGRRRRALLLTVVTVHGFPLPFLRKRVNRTVLCHQCRHAGGQGVDAMNSLDATAMAALASLVYVSGWKNRTLPIEIRAYSSKSKHAWRSGWAAERARWAKCAARAARAAPRVPGVQSAFLPPHGTIQKLGADCAPPPHTWTHRAARSRRPQQDQRCLPQPLPGRARGPGPGRAEGLHGRGAQPGQHAPLSAV